MHVWTHLKPESEGKTGLGVYADGMVEHDAMVGQLLAELKELGVEDNTIVMYSTDNGAEVFTWPDGGTTMFAPAGYYVGRWLESFRDFPPRQKPGSFSLDRVMESITKAAGDK